VNSYSLPIDMLLTELAQKGVKLWVESDRLRVRAPKGVLTGDLRELLAGRKRELFGLLEQQTNGAADLALPQIVPAPQDRHLPFPLNDIQQAYWVGRTGGVELGNITTHGYLEFECPGIDPARLSRAMQKVVARHDMLRAVVLATGQQQILDQVPLYEIENTDLAGRPKQEIDNHLEAVRNEMSHQVLPLGEWPLFQIRTTQIEEDRTRIHFSIDLIITDFGSLLLLVKEWSFFYRNIDASLPPLQISFRDFILTEQKIQETAVYQRAQRYWLDRLDTLPPRPQLPLAKNPAMIEKPHFKRRRFVLDAAAWEQLRRNGREHGLTASGILLAAFAEVLTIWSQSPQFSINLTQYNRLPLHPQVNEIVGNSISVILLAVDNSHPDNFLERAKRVQQQLWLDLNHTYFNGVRVLREWARRQRHSQGAIMPVVFTSILGLESLGKTASADFGELIYCVSQTPQVWLDHQAMEHEGCLITSWDAVEELFPENVLDDMFAAYTRLLQELSSNQQTWQKSAPAMIPSRQLVMRHAVNDTATVLPEGMLHTGFAAHALTQPNADAVITGSRTLTYRQLFETANRLARLLRSKGAVPNLPIAIVAERGWEQIVAVMGILIAGAAYMPIDPEVPAERLDYLLGQTEAKFVLTQSRLVTSLRWPQGIVQLPLDTLDLSAFDADPLPLVQTQNDLAYVLFTSGSTGQPKGAMLEHLGPLNTVTYFNQHCAIGPQDRALALSALNFDLSVYDIFGMLSAGGALVIPDPSLAKDPAHWVDLMSSHGVTLWNSVPTLMKMMVEHLSTDPARAPLSLRTVILSGDWIPLTLPDRIKRLWHEARVVGAGGPTENSVWNVCHPIDVVDLSRPSIPYGQPIANNRYHVLDGRLQHRPDWVPGELLAEGVGLARGYWRDVNTTNAKFQVHPQTGNRLYHTGDLGRYLPDGTIEILGRTDFQVKISGYRIELGEIEAALRQHDGVCEAVVSAVGGNQEDKRLVAYIVPRDGSVLAEPLPPRDAGADRDSHHSLDPDFQETLDVEGMLSDPILRVEFKLGQRGLREFKENDTPLDLPQREFAGERSRTFLARHSTRLFRNEPVPLPALSLFLDCLQQMRRDDAPIPKRMYPSAGSLYPVQAYLHIKPGRVDGLEGGTYYYDPSAHRLFALDPAAAFRTSLHVETNRQIFEQAAFSIFLVAKFGAIVPIYGKALAHDFSMLEAGYIGQLLMQSATEHGIGICPIGAVKFDGVRKSFLLDEDHILLHSLVGGLAVEAEAHPARTQLRSTRQILVDDLRRFLEKRLPAYMVPSAYVFLETMPLNANRKVDRRALPDPAIVPPDGVAEAVPPKTDLQRRLAVVVQEVLQIEFVSMNSNFFDLGANSVHLVQIHGKLTSELGRSVPIVELFRHPTISFLAQYLSEGEQEDGRFEQIRDEAEKRKSERLKRHERRSGKHLTSERPI
jgi:amino acid adenylation domain-containing protein